MPNKIRSLDIVIGAVWVPLFVGLLALILLSFPDQTLELYRALAEDSDKPGILFGALFGIGWLAAILGGSTSYLANTSRADYQELPAAADFGLRMAPLLIAALPLAGLVTGVYFAAPKYSPDWGDQVAAPMEVLAMKVKQLSVAALLVSALALSIFYFVQRQLDRDGGSRRVWLRRAISGYKFQIALIGIVLGLVFIGVRYPVWFPVLLGPINIACLFLIFLCLFMSLASYGYARTGVPFITLLVLLAFGFSYTNANNQVDLIDDPAVFRNLKNDKRNQRVEKTFLEWYVARGDLDHYTASNPYPVYFIAAEGGGMFAAYHAGMFLARLQDNCPNFAQHIFSISGVSGGSLGAAVFAGLVHEFGETNGKARPCRVKSPLDGRYQNAARAFLQTDFLSPTLWAGLFPDFLQRFWPVGVPALSRARALETSFETAWARVFPQSKINFFQRRFGKYWSVSGAAPALWLNTTRGLNGKREIVAPFAVGTNLIVLSGEGLGWKRDLQVKSAVGLSARFPILTPAGRVTGKEIKGGYTMQLVDGGYFENSGMETLHNFVSDLKRSFRGFARRTEGGPGDAKPAFQLSVVSAAKNIYEVLDLKSGRRLPPFQLKLISVLTNLPLNKDIEFGDIKTPLIAALNARVAHGRHSMRVAQNNLCPACSFFRQKRSDTVRFKVLDGRKFVLALGWKLSPSTQRYISDTLGSHEICKVAKGGAASVRDRNCMMKFIVDELN